MVQGRSDGVVKIGGRQILSIPDVGDAFVFGRPAAGGRQNDLLALVKGEIGPSEIRTRRAIEALFEFRPEGMDERMP